jgi:hypothetical protein
MQIAQAKEYFNLGIVTGIQAVRDPMAVGAWLLVVMGKEGRSWTLQTKLGKAKSFSSLDTLAGQVEQIAGRCVGMNFCL